MTIMEALKEERGFRVTYGDRWMVWDRKMDWGSGKARGAWVVYRKKYNQRNTQFVATPIITTADEKLAVRYLLYQET